MPTALRSCASAMRRAASAEKFVRRTVSTPVGQAPVGIAGGDPDGLGAEIEPDERPARRQERRDLGKRQDGSGHAGA